MPVKSVIEDGRGKGHKALVIEENCLGVSEVGYPPITPIPQKVRIFRGYLTTAHPDSTADDDMRINASSSNPAEYVVTATDDADRYITMLSFMIADASGVLNKFGALAALTNGCHLYYETEQGIVTIHEALRTNWDFVRLCCGNPAFGDGFNAFLAGKVIGNSEGYIPVLDIKGLMPPYGIRLSMGTKQRIVLKVRDDTTGVDGFDCIAYGFDRFE